MTPRRIDIATWLLFNAIAFLALSLWLFRQEEAERMYEQLSLESLAPTGEVLKDQALDRLEDRLEEWIDEAADVVRDVAACRETFTADDVWEQLERRQMAAPVEPRAMGAVFRRAQARHVCAPTDRTVRSTRPECHSRPIRVWRSLVVRS